MKLKNKTAIITGGSNGLGKATAFLFSIEGANVVIADMDEKAGQSVVNEIKANGNNALFVKVDVSNPDSVANLIESALKEFGKIHILINNAGIVSDARLVKMDIDQWQKVIDVNLKGVFICAQAVSKVLIDQGEGGSILNTSSVVGLYGNFGQSNYVASKAGVIGMTKTWAKELGKYNIRVNAVAPGFMETEIIKSMPEKVINLMKEKTLLQRLGKPDDIANAFLYLASDEGSYVTGTVLSVDGGIII
jgi:3-oxoacyl-[acyl-carrier protein] reductase